MNQLPNGWKLAMLEEACLSPKQDIVDGPFGSNLKATEYTDSGVPIIRLQNVARNQFIDKNIKYVSAEKYEQIKRHSFIAGDIVITKLGEPLGKATIVPSKFTFGIIVADIVRLRLDEKFGDRKYFTYAINSPQTCKLFVAETKGSTRQRVNLSHIRSLEIPIAPLPEQKRIAKKLDTLLARVDACRERLNRVSLTLKRFKQSVLAAATAGKLTEDWRADQAIGDPLMGNSWREMKISNIFEVISGFAFKSEDFVKSGVPVIKISNIQYGVFEEKNQEYFPLEMLGVFSKFQIVSGDLLLALTRPITNGQLKICRYPELAPIGLLNQRVCKLQIKPNFVQRYFEFAFQSNWFINQVQDGLSETLQPNLSPKDLENFIVPTPSNKEQHEIVRRVETLFALADRLEARLITACNATERLTPALLAKAFRGELLPQDPDDEPASELLARISAMAATKARKPNVSTITQSTKIRVFKEKKNMAKSRQDVEVKHQPYLAEQLRKIGGAANVEALFKVADLPVTDFYKQLAWEVENGHIRDAKPLLEAA